jgi:hypothetical protein
MKEWSKPVQAAIESFMTAENQMNKKWGWYAWFKMTTPELAAKYQGARERYLKIKDPADKIKACENLSKGLKVIDQQLCEAGERSDVFYLQARINGRNYYFVNDKLDMQRVIPLMKGKDPVVYMMDEIVTIIEAHGTDVADTIKSVFPGAAVSSIEFKHNKDQLDDEIPF